MHKVKLILIIVIVVLIVIFVVVWFLQNRWREKNITTSDISSAESTEHFTRIVPTSLSSSITHGENSNQSSSHLPFISACPSKPPPLGFGHPDVDETTIFNANGHTDAHSPYPPKPPLLGFGHPDENETTSFNVNSHVDTYPPTRRAPYPIDSESSRSPYPAATSCYPPTHTTPYPLSNSMPQPSTSRISCTSERNTRGVSNSTRIAPYLPDHETPHLFSDESRMPQPSSSRTSYFPESNTLDTIYSRRTARYSPARGASRSTEQPPPSYEDVISDRFSTK